MNDLEKRFIEARTRAIATDYAHLNPRQLEGVLTTEGPLLLLAGAGSGKTTVLIQRVYNLLTYGRGSDSDEVPDWATEEDLRFLENLPEQLDEETRRRAVRLCAVDVPRPWEILAITFTNKAAREMRERAEKLKTEGASGGPAGPGGGGHLGLHVPLCLRAYPPAGHRPHRLRQGLYDL